MSRISVTYPALLGQARYNRRPGAESCFVAGWVCCCVGSIQCPRMLQQIGEFFLRPSVALSPVLLRGDSSCTP